jgi:predicted ribosome quality control (RQC) complex YloA/Tae2 family protein
LGKALIFNILLINLMLTNYHTLCYIASYTHSKLQGQVIQRIFSQDKDILVFSFGGFPDSLIFYGIPDANTFYLDPRFTRAKRNTADLLKECWGEKIRSIHIHPSDRVVTFDLESGFSLQAQFFGSKANVLLVDETGILVDSFKKSKTLAGTKYLHAHPDLIYDMTLLSTQLKQDENSTVSAILKKIFPTFGSTLVREALFRSKISPSTMAAEIDSTMISALQKAASSILAEISSPHPRVYFRKNNPRGRNDFSLAVGETPPVAFSIIRLYHYEQECEKLFEDVHEAVRFFISRRRVNEDFNKQKSSIVATLRRQQDKTQRTIGAIGNDLQNDAREKDYMKFASLIMANIPKIKKGSRALNLDDGNEEITIPLDFRLSPAQNAQKYFESAKKSRAAQQKAKRRLRELRSTSAAGESLLEAVEQSNSIDELRKLTTTRANELDRFDIGEKSKQRAALPFRIFTVDGGFEVWAGKSSANNDVLTLKYGKPNDLWFHTRGSSGSHVLLKINTGKGEPSRKAKTQAASIAAYYSKMKNAKLVPVAMTQRRYVRKPKGSPPGTVTLQREKVIFTEPALPSS